MTFWKTFWASLLASIVSGLIVIGIFFLILNVMISGFTDAFENKRLKVEDHTVLHMTLDGAIGDYSYTTFDKTAFNLRNQFGLSDILRGLEIAKADKKVEGIFLNCDEISCGMATLKEIRDALIDFGSEGKFVIAYSENYSTKAYYLASAADQVYVFPSGMLNFLGLGAELVFIKGALEKLDIEMQIIRGSNNKYKSAIEPLIAEQMSEANREQTTLYLTSLWNVMKEEIGTSRGIKVTRLDEIADSVYIRKSGDAVKYKMADAVAYYDQVIDTLKTMAKTEDGKDLELLSFQRYVSKKVKKERNLDKLKDKNLAVIFAEGEIVDGIGELGQIGGNSLAEDIRAARLDEDVKAVVLRINSPGGSALASEVIWREVILTKAVKPVVVSMGNVAASGGYYIACGADKIYAQPNTITGSIGVFGIIPYTGDLFKNKLGVTFDRVQTNDHAILSMNKRLTEPELKIIQEEVDDIYEDFIRRVSEGRGIEMAMVDSIGQGRVWAGRDALQIGLVDEFGGLTDAINHAAELAKIESKDISISYYPKSEDEELEKLLELLGDSDAQVLAQNEMQVKVMELYKYFSGLTNGARIQARMPYLLTIE